MGYLSLSLSAPLQIRSVNFQILFVETALLMTHSEPFFLLMQSSIGPDDLSPETTPTFLKEKMVKHFPLKETLSWAAHKRKGAVLNGTKCQCLFRRRQLVMNQTLEMLNGSKKMFLRSFVLFIDTHWHVRQNPTSDTNC